MVGVFFFATVSRVSHGAFQTVFLHGVGLFTLDSRHCCVLKLRGRDGNKMGGGRGKG